MLTTTTRPTRSPRSWPRSARASGAVLAGRWASHLSRLSGAGDGTAIGGRVATTVMPDLVPALSAGMRVALVSATNGKSTVATMLSAAVGVRGRAAFNSGGSNMVDGVAMALAESPRAAWAVLEVDEMVLADVARATNAGWVVLMNASREYTRGVSLERTLEHWRVALADPGFEAVVIANADDPVVVAVTEPLDARGRVVWVAGGLHWREDGRLCRRCGSQVHWPEPDGPDWSCGGCGMTRPRPHWWLVESDVHGPEAFTAPLTVTVPGRWIGPNALFAVAAASAMGVPPRQAVRAVSEVSDVDGRYRTSEVDGRRVRLFLVKNPASWAEAVSLAAESDVPTVLAMESFSMRDLTPGWDVDLSPLSGTHVVVTGQRRLDVAVMLEAAGVAHTVVTSPVEAVHSVPPGDVHIIANYTAFKDLRRGLA